MELANWGVHHLDIALWGCPELGLLTEVAGRLEQKLKWDPKREEFVANDEANRMLHRPMQNGWKL